ncbi:MAG: hypothetical protein H0T53_01140 [Herpetosiphonaceae bacterium]|nr:hypothetical protein [Herpetosiphonaceae bacterium]
MNVANDRLSTALGAINVALMALSAPVSRHWFNRWGATAAELASTLPYTRAITIKAPPSAIWPWLVQLGQGRGGLYSYDGLENMLGCDIHSANTILPAYQKLQVGDEILFGPAAKKFPGQLVLAIQPERAILMCGLNPASRQPETSATWVFVLEPQPNGTTRLLVRGRNAYAPGLANHLLWHLVEPVAFVMERRMLRGIKQRAERSQTHS